ncbi:MAG: ParB/RepB/Spo0J family partition protein [Eubacterium sp.]|nr:ParB/RepB/Spo0J family partition protein [Eubacterium sp.]
MATKKNALGKNPLEKKGKGLNAVIDGGRPGKAPAKSEAAEVTPGGEVSLKINQVEPNKNQPRKEFDQEKLQELADSIAQHGIVQPIVVTKQDDYYEIIAGERRWRAAKLAGLKEVPVVIKEYTPQEVMEVALIENIQREDLNPVEEAKAYQHLIEEYNLKQEDVAKKVSKNRSTITNAIRLLKLEEPIQEMLISGDLSSGHARALLAVEDPKKQLKLAERIVKEHLNVREVEKLVKEDGEKSSSKPKQKKSLGQEAIYEDLEERLTRSMGTKVRINRKNANQGKIEIEYYSMDELDTITARLTK